jgi:hypothetical protein
MDEREELRALRGDSLWRRLVMHGLSWLGVTLLLFLLAIRFGGPAWDAGDALTALIVVAIGALPLSWIMVQRRMRWTSAAKITEPVASEEPVELGYRGAPPPAKAEAVKEREKEEEETPHFHAGLVDYLKVYALVALVATGGVLLGAPRTGHVPGVALAFFAFITVPALVVALGVGVQRALHLSQARRREELQSRALAEAVERVPVPMAERSRVLVETSSSTEARIGQGEEEPVSDEAESARSRMQK